MCEACGNPNLSHDAATASAADAASKPVWTSQQVIDQLDSGLHWSGTNLTYGFPTDASWFPYTEKDGFSALGEAQKTAATLAIKLWDDLITPDFSLAANGAT